MSQQNKDLVRRWFEEVWNNGRAFTGMGFVRVADGKVVESWNNFDRFGMFQQLGIINPPQPG